MGIIIVDQFLSLTKIIDGSMHIPDYCTPSQYTLKCKHKQYSQFLDLLYFITTFPNITQLANICYLTPIQLYFFTFIQYLSLIYQKLVIDLFYILASCYRAIQYQQQIIVKIQKNITIISMGNHHDLYQEVKQKTLQRRQQKFTRQVAHAQKIYAKYNITAQKALKICSYNLTQLIELINEGKITSQQVVGCVIYRCATVGSDLNVFTFTNFIEALGEAERCDAVRKQSGMKNWVPGEGDFNKQKHLPPLFGVPISIKDVFDMKGLPTTFGGILSKTNDCHQDSQLLTCLKNAGAIPFIKTNIPQLSMTMQTNNTLWGKTLNPWNTERSAGGSSGGQGAIVGARCSFLGVGSDIGGSVRVPALHCGVFGLKPYSRRVSLEYFAYSQSFTRYFQRLVPNSIGPLGKSARDLALFMDVATNQQNYAGKHDPYTKIVPFDWKRFIQVQQSSKKKYRIGYFYNLQDFHPSNATKRAVRQVLQILVRNGHQIVEIQMPEQKQLISWFNNQLSSTKGQWIKQSLKGQKHDPLYNPIFQSMQMWAIKRYWNNYLLKTYQPRIYNYFHPKSFQSIIEYQSHAGLLSPLRKKWTQYWRQQNLDFIIAPGIGCQAHKHDRGAELLLGTCVFTYIWNVLDCVAGAIPVTTVRGNELGYEDRYGDSLTRGLREMAEGSQGLPVGVQVVGLPYCEEEVLGLMSYLERKIQFYKHHPLKNI